MSKVVKGSKIELYLNGFLRRVLPSGTLVAQKEKLLKRISDTELVEVKKRVDYYCKDGSPCDKVFHHRVADLKNPRTPKAYYFDTYEYARFFPDSQPINYEFGDVTWIPKLPAIVKSRPIADDNQCSVLLNLDKVRHFAFVHGDRPFDSKKNMLIGRSAVYQPHRYDFYKKYFNHPLCDLGQVNREGGNPAWIKPRISIEKHLDFKFILSLQGNDVATNLKWIMSSNSIAVMPKPTIETWFMEGTLIGGTHYIEIKPDYSDLEEKLKFYIADSAVCHDILENAHRHCEKFYNPAAEDLCSLMVLEKYFKEF